MAAAHRMRRNRDALVLATDELKLTLFAGTPWRTDHGDVPAGVDVAEGETVTFVLHGGDVHAPAGHEPAGARALFDDAAGYRRRWLGSSTHTRRWREMSTAPPCR